MGKAADSTWYRDDADTMLIEVKAIPGAQVSSIDGIRNGVLLVHVAAAPEKGKANAELVKFFSKSLGCAKSEIELVRGETSRNKLVRLSFEAFGALKAIIRP
ncbi:MAG: DUF167 domain-containing protein [Spirochaetes bacterium]|nr:DUF167 domain-containing protein [Spirochaetota bacterium]